MADGAYRLIVCQAGYLAGRLTREFRFSKNPDCPHLRRPT
jgi:hypothetical protein